MSDRPPTPRQAAIDLVDAVPGTATWTSHINYDEGDPTFQLEPSSDYGGMPEYMEQAFRVLTDKERMIVEAVLFEGIQGDELAHRFGHSHRWPPRRIYLAAIDKLRTELERTA